MAYQPNGKYSDDDGGIHPIRLSTTDYAAGGTAPTGDVDEDVSAQVGKSRRSYGLHARYVLLGRTVGTAPDTFTRYKKLVVLTQTAFNGGTFSKGSTVTVGGNTWTIKAKVPELQK